MERSYSQNLVSCQYQCRRTYEKGHTRGTAPNVWFHEAMQWMKSCAVRREPFFAYLAINAPHGPLWVPEKYAAPYKGKVAPPIANFFGMIANIDENMARLDAMLKESGLYDNTILVFMTDNGGTAGVSVWNAGMPGARPNITRAGTGCPALSAGRPADCGNQATSPSWRSAKTCCPRSSTCAGCASPKGHGSTASAWLPCCATIRSPNWPIGSSWCSTVFTRSTSAPPNGTVP